TRFSRDWSSDVCSSDLLFQRRGGGRVGLPHDLVGLFRLGSEKQFLQPTDRHRLLADHLREVLVRIEDLLNQLGVFWIKRRLGPEIGRASRREKGRTRQT